MTRSSLLLPLTLGGANPWLLPFPAVSSLTLTLSSPGTAPPPPRQGIPSQGPAGAGFPDMSPAGCRASQESTGGGGALPLSWGLPEQVCPATSSTRPHQLPWGPSPGPKAQALPSTVTEAGSWGPLEKADLWGSGAWGEQCGGHKVVLGEMGADI